MKSLKWFLWGLNICLLCVTIFLGYKIYNQKILAETNARISQTISQELTEVEKHQDYALQSGMIDQTFVSVAYPTDASKKVIKAVETEMKSYVEKSFGKSEKVGEVRHLAFLNATSSDLGLDKVKKYSLQVSRYENTEKTIKKVEENHIKDILVDNEGNVFSLAQLVSDEGFLKEKLLGKLEVALNESNQLNDSTKSQVENLRQNDFKNLSFNLTEGQLTINLPEKIADQESISLPLSDLYEKIDSNYLMGSDLESYNAYQEEKVRAEERAKSLMSGHPQVALEGKVVALTFDDGPNPASTPRILDTLKQYNADRKSVV